jgi:hypothetical protein
MLYVPLMSCKFMLSRSTLMLGRVQFIDFVIMSFSRAFYYFIFSTAVEMVTFIVSITMTRSIRKVLGSNLGPENGHPDWGFSRFFSVLLGECRDCTLKLGHDSFLPNPLQCIIHLSFHSTLYGLSYWKSIVNKLQTNCHDSVSGSGLHLVKVRQQ